MRLSYFIHSVIVLSTAVVAFNCRSMAADTEVADGEAENGTPPAAEKHKKKAKKAATPEEEQTEATQNGDPEKSADAEATPLVTVTRSQTSIALDERLTIGTGIGWAYVKPQVGKWQGVGASTVVASWRKSPKPEGNLFITGSYTPYTGAWLVDERYYDTTVHALMAGVNWLFPLGANKGLKAGVELGYLMVYANPQDRVDADGKVKGGKFAGGGSLEMDWTLLGKVKVGPMIRVHGGGFSTAFAGAVVNYVF